MTLAELESALVTLQARAAEIKGSGDCLQDCWIGRSAGGGNATGLGKQPGRYATVRSRNGRKTEYISIEDPTLLAAREAAIARGRQLTKLEREIKKVTVQLDQLIATAARLGLPV
ncbi:hypothetical protein AB3R30_26190 [Leptolyngbyaceae cyanobacterium UHCC 1019]